MVSIICEGKFYAPCFSQKSEPKLYRKTTSFKIIGITSSSRYSLKVVTGIAATRRRKVTIKATSNSLSSQITQYVTGSEYDIPNFILKAGVETTVQIHDPAAGSNKVSQLIVSLPNGVAAAYYPASSAVLSGNAKLLECSETPGACLPTGNKITNITSVTTSPTTAVTFKEVSSNTIAGPKMVYIDYINYDLAFDLAWNGLGTNTLNLTFSVNGGKGKYLQLPISGGDWEDTGRMGILLDGFVQDATPGVGKNEVKVWAPGWRFGADLVGIEVVG